MTLPGRLVFREAAARRRAGPTLAALPLPLQTLPSLRQPGRPARRRSAIRHPGRAAPREQHYTIRFGDSGHSYETIMADYLPGATKVRVEDPYIRATLPAPELRPLLRDDRQPLHHSPHSAHHRLRRLIQKADAESKLQDLAQSLLELDIVLEVSFDPNLHDREIRLDNGWVIKIGRGLDFYQRPTSWFDIGSNDLTLRKCLETKVDIYRDMRAL